MFTPKFTKEEIAEIYEKWKRSNLDLKTFCTTYTPTPLPYTTIYRRFQRMERNFKKYPIDLPTTPEVEKPILKTIAKQVTSQAEFLHNIYFTLGKDLYPTINQLIDDRIYKIYTELGKFTAENIHIKAMKMGINPKKLTTEQIISFIDQKLIEELVKQESFNNLVWELTSLKCYKIFLNTGKFPKSWQELE